MSEDLELVARSRPVNKGSHSLHVYAVETYLLTKLYFRRMYRNTRVMETLLAFYIGFALLLAFTYFQLNNSAIHATARISAITLIRLSITINTMPVFVTVFQRARREEIAGFGKDGLAFDAVSVYFAKFIALNSFRVLFFIPFTAIIYPIVNLRHGFGHVLVFFLTLAVQQMAAIALGLLVSAIFVDPTKAGIVISTVVLITFLFSGSILLRDTIPSGLLWLEYLSISFYAHQALIMNEFAGRLFDDGSTGDQYLKGQSLMVLGVWPSLGALCLYTAICLVLGPLALTWTSRLRQ